MSDGDGGVVYSTKELLTRIEDKVDRINSKLDAKADRARMHEMAGDIAALHLLLATYPSHLLECAEVKKQVDHLRYWKAGVCGALLVLAALVSANGVHIWLG